jgi:DNA-binding transcriptional LysR family regulator
MVYFSVFHIRLLQVKNGFSLKPRGYNKKRVVGENPPKKQRERSVAGLIYSFAQLEAFTAVAENGSLSKAAVALKKDRTTLRDLVDFLEDGLGYALFIRDGRTLRLTPEGEQLQRQAHLLMRQVKAFEAFAREVPHGATQDLTLVYDPFTPRAFLHGVIAEMAVRKIRLSLICASRDESERLLANNDADLAICQARNRSVGNDMEWRAGAIEMDFYAASGLFADSASPLSLLDLSWYLRSSCTPPRTSRWRAACRFPGIPFYQ